MIYSRAVRRRNASSLNGDIYFISCLALLVFLAAGGGFQPACVCVVWLKLTERAVVVECHSDKCDVLKWIVTMNKVILM